MSNCGFKGSAVYGMDHDVMAEPLNGRSLTSK